MQLLPHIKMYLKPDTLPQVEMYSRLPWGFLSLAVSLSLFYFKAFNLYSSFCSLLISLFSCAGFSLSYSLSNFIFNMLGCQDSAVWFLCYIIALFGSTSHPLLLHQLSHWLKEIHIESEIAIQLVQYSKLLFCIMPSITHCPSYYRPIFCSM